jgi:hypothetical protein
MAAAVVPGVGQNPLHDNCNFKDYLVSEMSVIEKTHRNVKLRRIYVDPSDRQSRAFVGLGQLSLDAEFLSNYGRRCVHSRRKEQGKCQTRIIESVR